MLEIAGFIIGAIGLGCSIDGYIKTGQLVSNFRNFWKPLQKLLLDLTVQQGAVTYQCYRILWEMYDEDTVEKMIQEQAWDQEALTADLKQNTGKFFHRIHATLELVHDDLHSVKKILDQIGENPKDFHELILRTEKFNLNSNACPDPRPSGKSSLSSRLAWAISGKEGLERCIMDLRFHNLDLKNAVDDWTSSPIATGFSQTSNSITTSHGILSSQNSYLRNQSPNSPTQLQLISRDLLETLAKITWCKCHSIHWGFNISSESNSSNFSAPPAEFNFLLAPKQQNAPLETMSGKNPMSCPASQITNTVVARLRSKKLGKPNVDKPELGCYSKDNHPKKRRHEFSFSRGFDRLKAPANAALPQLGSNKIQQSRQERLMIEGLCSDLALIQLKPSNDQQYVGGIGPNSHFAHDLSVLGTMASFTTRLTLEQLLDNPSTTLVAPPTVRERLDLALTLSNAVLHLPPTIFPSKWRSKHISVFEHDQQARLRSAWTPRPPSLYFKPKFNFTDPMEHINGLPPHNTDSHFTSATAQGSVICKLGFVLLDLGLEKPLSVSKMSKKVAANNREQGINYQRHPADIEARATIAFDKVLVYTGCKTYQEIVEECIFWKGGHDLYQERTRELFMEKVIWRLEEVLMQY